MFTLYRIAFRSDAKTLPEKPYTRNFIFGAIFETARLCSAPILKVVRSISDGFSACFEPSIACNMESRKCLCDIVGLLQTILIYMIQSQQLIVFLTRWRPGGGGVCCYKCKFLWVVPCLSKSAVYIIPDNFLQQYRSVLFTLYRRVFCTGSKTFPV